MRRPDDWTSRIPVEAAGDALRLALRAGLLDDAPAVLFHDLDLLASRLGILRAAFPERTLHALAIKANPLIEVLRAAVVEGAGLEGASMEEVHLALAAGCHADRIVYDSPAKRTSELREALDLGVRVNADGLVELERIAELFSARASRSTIGLRVNPCVGEGRIAYTSVAVRGSRFGVSVDDEDRIVAAFRQFSWLTGLHVHVGSQGCSLDQIVAGAARVAALRERILRASPGVRIDVIDIGGGLPAVYRAEDAAIHPVDYVAALRREAPSLFASDVALVTEFGRSLQAGCGFALSRVEYVKPRPGGVAVVIHLGADLFLRPVYQPDQWHHDIVVLDPDGVPRTTEVVPTTIGGPLCFGGDIIGHERRLPEVQVGDWILIRDTGAYTLSMWSRHCSRGLPLVLGLRRGALSLLRRRETPADVVAFWSARGGGQIEP